MGTSNQKPQLSQYIMELIECKVRQLVGKAGIKRDDIEDIKQDLIRYLLERLPRFDPSRARTHPANRIAELLPNKWKADREADTS